MSSDMTSAEHFNAMCLNLKLLEYDSDGKAMGIYATEFLPRNWLTFENFCFAIFSETQLDKFILKVAVKADATPAEIDEALMGDTAAGLRMLHHRGVSAIQKAREAEKTADYEGAPPQRLDPKYMLARVNAYNEKHAEDEPLTEATRTGRRTWSKLHHQHQVDKFLLLLPLLEYRTQAEENQAKEVPAARLDPATGLRRESTEHQEVTKSLDGGMFALHELLELRASTLELEGLCAKKALAPLTTFMKGRLRVDPASGHRPPSLAEFLQVDELIRMKICELYNYKGLSLAAAIQVVLKDSELFRGLDQKVHIPQRVLDALNKAPTRDPPQGVKRDALALSDGAAAPPTKLSKNQKKREKAAAAKAKTQGGKPTNATFKDGNRDGNYPSWWGKSWVTHISLKAGEAAKPVCQHFHASKGKGCSRGGGGAGCKFLHNCPKAGPGGYSCKGLHPAYECPKF